MNIKEILKQLDPQIKNAIWWAINIAKKKIEEKTPEDTKKLIWNYKIEPLKTDWNTYSQKIVNETKYAYWVEYWVGWKVYNYQKPKWNKGWYRWIGARMMTRTSIEDVDEITKFIKWKIKVKWNR